MNKVLKDGVTLAYEERGSGAKSILFIHGLGFDHSTFEPQMEFFEQSARVVAVDLRGHGESGAPHQNYAMPTFAEDVDWLCAQLNLERPIIVGHSMGGNVALTLAGLYPDLPESILLIDSLLFPPPPMRAMLKQLGESLQGPNFDEVRAQVEPLFFLPTDDTIVRAKMTAVFSKVPQYVIQSGFVCHTLEYDAGNFAAGCKVPVAYIGAANPLADLVALRAAIPEIFIAQTLGSGHFSPVMVPNQINAMIARFLQLSASHKSGQLK
jgi:pimeloyl-ACP methyl ester carboxylesterase